MSGHAAVSGSCLAGVPGQSYLRRVAPGTMTEVYRKAGQLGNQTGRIYRFLTRHTVEAWYAAVYNRGG